jgi:hypothetical protein
MAKSIEINRAPVMTLWAVVVAERLGHSHDESLTLGRAVTGLNAYSKAVAIGLVQKKEKDPTDKKANASSVKRPNLVTLLGRLVPVVKTKDGLRALAKDAPIEPAAVERYLDAKFKESLPVVLAAMRKLAASRTPKALEVEAYSLYEKFRPKIPAGEAGWGKPGELSLDAIEALGNTDQAKRPV